MQHLILKSSQSGVRENPITNTDYNIKTFKALPQIISLDGLDKKGRPIDTHFDALSVSLTEYIDETVTVNK